MTHKPRPRSSVFPPRPRGIKGRRAELATLARMLVETRPTRIALVGSGGSGKSILAAALGHLVRDAFDGHIDWFRSGAWGFYTLSEMLALRFGTGTAEGNPARLRQFLADGPERLIVLDNHENDDAIARLFEALGDTRATFLITARRCLLSGVLLFPVIAPRATSGDAAFPRVAALTRLLRFNPLALDIADGLVGSGATTVTALAGHLRDAGVTRVRALEHEDDLPEVAMLVDWAWARLGAGARRLLGVLAHVEGDHVDTASLGKLARVAKPVSPLEALRQWRLVQQPIAGRYALHAVVRHALAKRTKPQPDRVSSHYLDLLERHPERLDLEQTHLFAAMEHASRRNDVDALLRIDALARRLDESVAAGFRRSR